MKKPINTADNSPLNLLLSILSEGLENFIPTQEKQGQASLVNSEVLPTKIRTNNGKQILEEAGVKFIGTIEDDPLFQYVKLPEGWKIEPTNHAMWSILVDTAGRTRANIFYKAAFYDRDAHMSLSTRFSVNADYTIKREQNVAVAHAYDGSTILHSTAPLPAPVNENEWHELMQAVAEQARKWLEERYPNWKDEASYWNLP